MRLDFTGERVLAAVAHPDDAELLCAGTLGRAKADGATVAILVFCQGDKGQPSVAIPDLATVRREEMEAAAAILGAELFCHDVPDGTLAQCTTPSIQLLDVFRRFRPTLVLSHSANDYHIDHRAASSLAEAASWQCASRGAMTSEPALECVPALWWMDTVGMHGFMPGFYVEISTEVDLKHAMLACHVSQLQRSEDQDFTSLSDLIRSQYTTRGRQCGATAAEAFRIHDVFKRARAW